jgi:leucyl-tRNA synthetase
MNIAVQVNGKLRGQFEVSTDIDKDTLIAEAKGIDKIKRHIEGKEIIKEIYVQGRLVNFVVKE